MVDYSKLDLRVNEIGILDTTIYTKDSVKTLASSLAKAKTILKNKMATQAEVNSALTELNESFDALVLEPKPEVSFKALSKAITSAEAVDLEGYTAASIEQLNSALKKAKSLMSSTNTSQKLVDEAVQALEQAIEQLEIIKAVDLSKLETLIHQVEILELSLYTDESALALNEALSLAKAVLKSETASQEIVNASLEALNESLKALELKGTHSVSFNQLLELVKEAGDIDTKNFTESSVKNLVSTLDKAKALIKRSETELDQITQAEINEISSALQQAIIDLEILDLPVVDTPTNEKPTEEKPAKEKLPETGIASNKIPIFAGISFIVIGFILVQVRRRKSRI